MCPVTGSTVIILAEMEDTMSDFAGGLPGCLADAKTFYLASKAALSLVHMVTRETVSMS